MNGSTPSVRDAFWLYVRGQKAKKKHPTTGFPLQDPHGVVTRKTAANAGHLSTADVPGEVVHLLIDYRNKNEVLARKTMSRKKAFDLNHRMRNSGLGWSVKTGY